ncbi:MAG: thylakoid-associated protein [Desulfocapsa sp.]|nr:MAG: thylakoid-associated protein [Desulfocapsa sp.]
MITSSIIQVCLDRVESYDPALLRPVLEKHLDSLGVSADLSGKRILLKPNLITPSAPALACTNPYFTAAVAACFLNRGATVLLGDSPAFGSAIQVLKKHGFLTALSGYDVSFVKFKTKVVRTLDCGVRVTVAAEALDCDLFVDLPKVKAHQQMGVTLAMKNVFGIVLGARKAWLHMAHGESHQRFAELICDLQKILPPSIAIADGITAMHRTGPVNGSSLNLGCVALSKSFVALDRAMLEVLGVSCEQVPLMLEAKRQKLPGAELAMIAFPALAPDRFTGSGFRIPQQLKPVRFQFLQYFRSSFKKVFAS